MFIKCAFRKMTELHQGPTLGDTWCPILGDAICYFKKQELFRECFINNYISRLLVL